MHINTQKHTHHLGDAALHDAIHAEALFGLSDAHLAGVAFLLKDLECSQGGGIHGEDAARCNVCLKRVVLLFCSLRRSGVQPEWRGNPAHTRAPGRSFHPHFTLHALIGSIVCLFLLITASTLLTLAASSPTGTARA